MRIKLVFLSYGKLTEQIKKLRPLFPEEVIFESIDTTIDNIHEVVREVEARNEDCVLISSGANADLIDSHDSLRLPFVRIALTGADLLESLGAAMERSHDIGVVSYKDKLPGFENLAAFFPGTLENRTFIKSEEIDVILDEFYAAGIRDVIGGSLVGKRAVIKGLRHYSLRSEASVRLAIENAVQLAKTNKIMATEAQRLKTILDFTMEGIVATDREGLVELFNASAERITGIPAQRALGRPIGEVLENSNLLNVMNNNRREINQIQELSDVKILTNRVPIVLRDNVVGALATFQNIDVIQNAEEKIRRYQTRGFVAETRFDDIIGRSKVLERVKQEARRYAKSDSTVLIKGESGTGKDLFAQSIHNYSHRHGQPFVAINCAALPVNLLESELFGYEEGAFTGAKRGGKQGLFELAHGGTIFLDEIAEVSVAIQTQMLRVLERKEVMRIGGQKIIKVDVRIVAATNKDLWALIEAGEFRQDLYYRLNVLELRLPPLRERGEDLPLLVRRFLMNSELKLTEKQLEAIAGHKLLREYQWPGNIRELKNVMERLSVLYDQGQDVGALLEAVLFLRRDERRSGSEKNQLVQALQEAGGNRTAAAQKLGLGRTTLWRKMKEYGIEN